MTIYARNIPQLVQKLTKTLLDGPTNFKIVSDFDFTLSNTTSYASWTSIEQSPYTSDKYRVETSAMARMYHEKEIDLSIPFDQKVEYMLEWFYHSETYLREENISRDKYNKMLKFAQEHVCLRVGVNELFHLSHFLRVPLLVFSAGIGDIIDSVLISQFKHCYVPINPYYQIPQEDEQCQLENPTISNETRAQNLTLDIPDHLLTLHSPSSPLEYGSVQGIPRTIYIIANHLEFERCKTVQIDDSNNTTQTTSENNIPTSELIRIDQKTHHYTDVVSGFYTNNNTVGPIHILNKHEELVKTAPYYKDHIYPRRNVILMGDALGDADMVAKSSTDNVIRVGFLNTSTSKSVQKYLNIYLEQFDIVFVDCDDGIGWVNLVLKFFEDNCPTYLERENDQHNNDKSVEVNVQSIIHDMCKGVQQIPE
jgi:hypothetical protein